MKLKINTTVLFALIVLSAGAQEYNILNYKAIGDGKTINTIAIQKAVDVCAAKGGGTVLVPAGTFVTGMITLKTNVNLHLSAGAIVQAVANGTIYPSLIMVEKAKNVSITGTGTLFGNGKNFAIKESAPGRPYILFVRDSKKILIENITLKQSAAWSLRLYGNEHVMVKGVSIYSHANFNNDGIDIDSRDVVITGCIIDCSDDAICLKSEDPERLCENITITNCIAASNCNFIKMGTSSSKGFRNITVNNCVLRRASESPLHHWNSKPGNYISDSISGISGIALEMVDGGVMDQVSISNISMTGVQTPIFMRLGSRKNPTGSMKNVLISNIVATSHSRMTSIISGVPGFYIENVILRDIIINCKGEGTKSDAVRKVPENEKEYPENRMFGWSLPSYGLYIRHAKNIVLENVQFNLMSPDQRPCVWLNDAHKVKISGLKTHNGELDVRLIMQSNASDITVEEKPLSAVSPSTAGSRH